MGRSNTATVGRAREAMEHLDDLSASSGATEPHLAYTDQLAAEAQSWVAPDSGLDDKLLRERIRHPSLIKSLLLDRLPTHRFDVLEVGGGPLPLSDLLPFRSRIVVDPCTPSYREIAPCPDHWEATIEEWPDVCGDCHSFDLVIATNSLDHVRNAKAALAAMDWTLRKGGYMAIACNESNAHHHPHPSHAINLTVGDIHRAFDAKYETVWQLDYEHDRFVYGWRRVNGRAGQPAFCWLGRKAYDA